MPTSIFDQLIEQSQSHLDQVKTQISGLDDDQLNWKPNDKTWSILEVIEHLSIVYDLYFPKFDKVLELAEPISDVQPFSSKKTLLGRLSIYSQRPKKGKVKFKMKTFDFFEPSHSSKGTSSIIEKYENDKAHLAEIIRLASNRDVSTVKISTALGEKVKFYFVECIEFLLAHEARHLVQIAKAVENHSALNFKSR
ncbi:MAG: DinB family protein [Cyclobacteriaceae bacterium]